MLEQVQKQDPSERRYIPRWQVSNKVLYKKNKDHVYKECQSKDISCCGTCLFTDEELLPNQQLTLEIHLADDLAFCVDGRALWNSAVGEKFLTGVTFFNVTPKTQELILEYAFNFDKKSVVKHWFKGWES
jgi:hypothetical protein